MTKKRKLYLLLKCAYADIAYVRVNSKFGLDEKEYIEKLTRANNAIYCIAHGDLYGAVNIYPNYEISDFTTWD